MCIKIYSDDGNVLSQKHYQTGMESTTTTTMSCIREVEESTVDQAQPEGPVHDAESETTVVNVHDGDRPMDQQVPLSDNGEAIIHISESLGEVDASKPCTSPHQSCDKPLPHLQTKLAKAIHKCLKPKYESVTCKEIQELDQLRYQLKINAAKPVPPTIKIQSSS